MDTATSHEDELRAALAQLEKHHAGDHRGFNESRRSICEQSAQRLARAEAAERERDEARANQRDDVDALIEESAKDPEFLAHYRAARERHQGDRALRDRAEAAEARLAAVRDWANTKHGGVKTPAEVWPGLAAILAAPSPQAEPATCLAPGCSDGHQS